MVRRRLAFRRKRQNQLGMFLVTIAVVMLLIVVGICGEGSCSGAADCRRREADRGDRGIPQVYKNEEICRRSGKRQAGACARRRDYF